MNQPLCPMPPLSLPGAWAGFWRTFGVHSVTTSEYL